MTARELENAGKTLERKRFRAREAALVAVACAVLAAAAAVLSLTAAVACLVGATAAGVMALENVTSRRNLIAWLALEPRAHAIAPVRDYGRQLVPHRPRISLRNSARTAGERVRSLMAPRRSSERGRVSSPAHSCGRESSLQPRHSG